MQECVVPAAVDAVQHFTGLYGDLYRRLSAFPIVRLNRQREGPAAFALY